MEHDVPDTISMPPHHLKVNQQLRLERSSDEEGEKVGSGH